MSMDPLGADGAADAASEGVVARREAQSTKSRATSRSGVDSILCCGLALAELARHKDKTPRRKLRCMKLVDRQIDQI